MRKSTTYPMSSDKAIRLPKVNQKVKEERAERYKKTRSKGVRMYVCDVCDAHGKIRSRFHRCQACEDLQYCTTCARTETQLIHNHFFDMKERKGKEENPNKSVEGAALMRVYNQFPLLEDPDKGSLSRFFVCGTCYEEALQEEGLVQGDDDLYLLEDSTEEEDPNDDSDYEADDEKDDEDSSTEPYDSQEDEDNDDKGKEKEKRTKK